MLTFESRDSLVTSISQSTEPLKRKPFIIAISGFGGSGKSTLARELSERLGHAVVVPIDDFIRGAPDERSSDWQTFDRDRFRTEVLAVARLGHSIRYQAYHSGEWVNGLGGDWRTAVVDKYLIVEGCSILHPALMPHYDYSIWIDCTAHTAWERAKAREKREGKINYHLWDEVWGPNDMDFFNQFHPRSLATCTVKL